MSASKIICGRKRPRSPTGRANQTARRKNCDEMVEQLRARGESSPEISEKIIRNILENNSDEIAITTAKISLLCPLSKMFMSLPTRSITCNHLQCFDGQFYIKMNAVRKIWQCPICQQSCVFEDLIVDGFFMNILRSKKLKSNVTHIRLNIDGS